ncbi:hypothetical protein KFE25_013992 [Diacronema lutheri]|uniref:Phytanoyl-CoA dioxygenase n=2 Tax=Diacronema lutheri TaxID=2081491 RepID=A0A8J5X8V0_DIALT|nr:hypothetical protein KFE25_013992 [Diacronema lutheri]
MEQVVSLTDEGGAPCGPLLLLTPIAGTPFFTASRRSGETDAGARRNLRVLVPLGGCAGRDVDFTGAQGQYARWELVRVPIVAPAAEVLAALPSGSGVAEPLALRSAYASAHADDHGGARFLALRPGERAAAQAAADALCLSPSPTPLALHPPPAFEPRLASPQRGAASEATAVRSGSARDGALSPDELRAFAADGFVIARDVVARGVVDALRLEYNVNAFNALHPAAAARAGGAQRDENHGHGAGDGDGEDEGEGSEAAVGDDESNRSDEVEAVEVATADIHDNERTREAKRAVTASARLRGAIGSLLEPDNGPFVAPLPPGQDALNWPRQGAPPVARPFEQWHVDGMHRTATYPFALLVAIALSDQTRPDCGNLHASRGSHWPITNAIRQMRAAHAPPGLAAGGGAGGGGVDAVGAGRGVGCSRARARVGRGRGRAMEAGDLGKQLRELARRDVRPLEPLLLRAGDAALLHPKTAHRRGYNASPDVRYLLILRVRSPGLDAGGRGAAAGGGGAGTGGGGRLRVALDGPCHPAVFPGLHADPPTARLIDELAARWRRE